MKKFALLLAVILTALTLVGCSAGFMTESEMLKLSQNPELTITMTYTDADGIDKEFYLVYELRYDKAPITVTNFVNLVNEGFYNNSIISNSKTSTSATATSSLYYISGGNYKLASGEKKLEKLTKDYYIKGEFKANSWQTEDKEPLKHELGNLVMDRTSGASGFDTASTGWYICLSTWQSNDGNYAVFGTLKSMSGKVFKTNEAGEKELDYEIGSSEKLNKIFFEDMMRLSSSSQAYTTIDEKSSTVKIPSLTIVINMTVNTFGVTFPQAKTIKK